jgi:hypothetical protein
MEKTVQCAAHDLLHWQDTMFEVTFGVRKPLSGIQQNRLVHGAACIKAGGRPPQLDVTPGHPASWPSIESRPGGQKPGLHSLEPSPREKRPQQRTRPSQWLFSTQGRQHRGEPLQRTGKAVTTPC